MKLSEINRLYEEILHSDLTQKKKDLKFSELMTYMERAFDIPFMRNKTYEENNPAIIAMYRKLSMSRKTI